MTGVVAGAAMASGVYEPTRMNADGTETKLSSGETALVASAAILEGLLFAWSAYYGYESTVACTHLQAVP